MKKMFPKYSPENINLKEIDYIIDIMTSSTLSTEAYTKLFAEISDANIRNTVFNSISFSFPDKNNIKVLKDLDLDLILNNICVTDFDKMKADIFLTCYNHEYKSLGELYYNMINFVKLNCRNPLHVAGNSASFELLKIEQLSDNSINDNNKTYSYASFKHDMFENYVPKLKKSVKLNVDEFIRLEDMKG